MSIWGKILGGAAGFALGGPIGALLGGLAGHAIDRMRAEPTEEGEGGEFPRQSEATRQIAFTIGVIALGAKMAKADGRVTRDEIEAFREVFHVPPEEVQNVARVFNMARQDVAGFEAYAKQIARLFRGNREVLEDLLGGLIHIAKADNVIHPKEVDFLRKVAQIFGFSEVEFDRIRAIYLIPEEADPYAILGVSPDISDDELKRAYRALVRENHPDKLFAQGLPQEFIDVANEKLKAINDAYERVAKRRGLS
jgi:DnaJ like chaperone protein